MTTIVIELKIPDYDKFEGYSRWERREKPHCRYCECEMEYIGETNDADLQPGWLYQDSDWVEQIWQCPICRDYDTFEDGNYGEDEIEMSREEWDAEYGLANQRWLLMKRYGMYNPPSIRDYWQVST